VKRAQWLETRLERLLPVEHFHVVFTLPAALHPLVLYHPRRLYDLLFHAASQTLLTLAADGKRLGAQIGVTAIAMWCEEGIAGTTPCPIHGLRTES
jgi:hypothetical protein